MRLLLDENVATLVAVAIRNLVEDLHEITHVLDRNGSEGTKDLALWPMAADKGFGAVLTNDAQQDAAPPRGRSNRTLRHPPHPISAQARWPHRHGHRNRDCLPALLGVLNLLAHAPPSISSS